MNCDDHWESQVAVGRGIAARELVWPQFDMAMEHGPFADELHICTFNFTKVILQNSHSYCSIEWS